jgi:type IV secretion system protein TrbL
MRSGAGSVRGAIVPNGHPALAFNVGDLNPVSWLGDKIAGVASDAWQNAMVGLWSAALWMLDLAFKIVDAFTTPDVSSTGPLAGALPTTAWIGSGLALILGFVQIGTAAFRRDGKTLGHALVGIMQFSLVWAGFITAAALSVVAVNGLTQGLLSSMVHVSSWSQYSATSSWPRDVNDTALATVLGVCGVLLVIPAALGYIVMMLARSAALLLLVATSPISAAGLLSESTKAWFWKSLRWFIAALMIAPTAALVLGIGVQITNGILQGDDGSGVSGSSGTTSDAAATGTAIIGVLLVAIGAIAPIALFKMLAFVDPGTPSGTAMRGALAAAGGIGSMLSGSGGAGSGSNAATATDETGRAQGESISQGVSESRLSTAYGALGAAGPLAESVAEQGSRVLESAGVGHPGATEGGTANAPAESGGSVQAPPDDGQEGSDAAEPPATAADHHTPTATPPGVTHGSARMPEHDPAAVSGPAELAAVPL